MKTKTMKILAITGLFALIAAFVYAGDITAKGGTLFANKVVIGTELTDIPGNFTYAYNGDGNFIYRTASGSVGTAPPRIGFQKSRGTLDSPLAVSAGDALGVINFIGYNGTGYQFGAQIRGIVDTDAAVWPRIPTYLEFRTSTATTAITERMRIASNGNVGIGTTIPTEKLSIVGNIRLENNATVNKQIIEIKTTDANTPQIQFMGGSESLISSVSPLALSTAGSERMLIASNGDVIINSLIGAGKALVCVDATGKLYRGTATACP